MESDATSVTLQVHSNWKAITTVCVIFSVTQFKAVAEYGLPIPLSLAALSSVIPAMNLIAQPLGAVVLRKCTEDSTRNVLKIVHVNPPSRSLIKAGFRLASALLF